jgi:hypothetical protein
MVDVLHTSIAIDTLRTLINAASSAQLEQQRSMQDS